VGQAVHLTLVAVHSLQFELHGVQVVLTKKLPTLHARIQELLAELKI